MVGPAPDLDQDNFSKLNCLLDKTLAYSGFIQTHLPPSLGGGPPVTPTSTAPEGEPEVEAGDTAQPSSSTTEVVGAKRKREVLCTRHHTDTHIHGAAGLEPWRGQPSVAVQRTPPGPGFPRERCGEERGRGVVRLTKAWMDGLSKGQRGPVWAVPRRSSVGDRGGGGCIDG